jgi:uncharacterized protein
MIDSISGRNLIQQAALSLFLESSRVPRHSMNFYQLDGYLCAICSAPVTLDKAIWLPLVFNERLPSYIDAEEELLIEQSLLALHAYHLQSASNKQCYLPCRSVYASLKEERVDVEQWARGFLQGYIVSESAWNQALDRAAEALSEHNLPSSPFFDELDAIIYIVSSVADAEYALQQGVSVDDLVRIFERLSHSMILLGQIRWILREHLLARASSEMVAQFSSVNFNQNVTVSSKTWHPSDCSKLH